MSSPAFEQLVQSKAEAHLQACEEALYDESDGRPVQTPAYGPYDGGAASVAREVLSCVWDDFMAEARRLVEAERGA